MLDFLNNSKDNIHITMDFNDDVSIYLNKENGYIRIANYNNQTNYLRYNSFNEGCIKLQK